MTLIYIFITITILVFTGFFLYVWYRLHFSVNLHVATDSITPEKFGLQYQTKTFKTIDGITIASWYIPVKNPKAFIILVHGYTTDKGGKSLMTNHAKYLHESGYTTLSIDLRSAGGSTGKKISFGVHEWKDVKAAHEYLQTLPETKGKKIGLFGISMGAATVIVTAGKTGIGDFIIASVPYANFKRLFEFQIRNEGLFVPVFLPLLQLAGYIEFGLKYNYFTPSKVIEKITVPITLFSAENDEKVNNQDAKYLFNLAKKPKYFWQAPTNHDIYKYQPLQFKREILKFLNSLELLPRT